MIWVWLFYDDLMAMIFGDSLLTCHLPSRYLMTRR